MIKIIIEFEIKKIDAREELKELPPEDFIDLTSETIADIFGVKKRDVKILKVV